MADIQIENLIKEVKAGNVINQKLLDQKILDDTPKQLFMNNLFEILNARDLFAKQNEVLTTDQPSAVGQQITKPLDKGFTDITGKGTQGNLNFLGKALLNLISIQNDSLELTAKLQKTNIDLFATVFSKALKNEFIDVRNALRTFTTTTNEMTIKNTQGFFSLRDELIKVGDEIEQSNDDKETPSQKESREKKEKATQKGYFASLRDSFNAGYFNLLRGFSKLSKSLVGKAGFITVAILAFAVLLKLFDPFADVVAGLLTMIFSFVRDLKRFFMGDMSIGDFYANQIPIFLTTLFLTVFKPVRAMFLGLAIKLKLLGKLLLRFVAIPFLILEGIAGFFEGYMDTINRGGGILEAIGNGLMLLVERVVTALFDLFFGAIEGLGRLVLGGEVVESIKSGIGNVLSSIGDFFKFGGGREMGGPVAAGTGYLVGEAGPEVFVPGAPGAVLPGIGSGPIIVNNNQVNAPTSTHAHQHSNISIVDSQQEITGL